MAIGGDLTRRVLTTYAADTSQQETALATMKVKVDESAQSFVEFAKSANEGLNGIVEGLGKLNQAFEGAHKIIEGAKEAVFAYGDQLRLTAASGSADIEKLSEAAAGLKSEHDLLTFAAQTQHGVFKLNQDQMETVQRAMVALTRAGFDQQDVTDKVTNAVIGLKTKGLDKLGISVKQGKDDAESFNNILEALAQKASLAGDSTSEAAESGQRMGVEWQNAIEKLKVSIGQLIVQLEPLVSLIAKAIGYIAEAHPLSVGVTATPHSVIGDFNAAMAQQASDKAIASIPADGSLLTTPGGGFTSDLLSGPAAFARSLTGGAPQLVEAKIGDWLTARKKAADLAREKAKELAEARRKLSDEVAKSTTDDLVKQLEGEVDAMHGGTKTDIGSWSAVLNGGAGVPNDVTSAMLQQAKVQQQAAGYGAFNAQKESTFLEKTFGKVSEFDLYKEAFTALSGAVGASMKAWIDGSMSAGEAFKKFIADALTGLASQMLIESLKHGAYALGSLAFGDLRGAAQHAAAAAAFGAGAIAAGFAAKELGAGSSSTSSASTRASSSTAAAAGGAANSNTAAGPIIVYGDSFSEDSPRMRQVKAQKMWQRATGTSYARAG